MIKVFLIPVEETVAQLDTLPANIITAYESGKTDICVMDLDEFERGFNLERLPRNLEEHNVRFINYDKPDRERIVELILEMLDIYGIFSLSDLLESDVVPVNVYSGANVSVEVTSVDEGGVIIVSFDASDGNIIIGEEHVSFELLDFGMLEKVFHLVGEWAKQEGGNNA